MIGTADVASLAGVHRSTVWLWISRGVPPQGGGNRVRLQGRRVGGRWKTTRKLFRRFLDALEGRSVPLGLTPAECESAAQADVEEFRREVKGWSS